MYFAVRPILENTTLMFFLKKLFDYKRQPRIAGHGCQGTGAQKGGNSNFKYLYLVSSRKTCLQRICTLMDQFRGGYGGGGPTHPSDISE